jgi:hypothetical protein
MNKTDLSEEDQFKVLLADIFNVKFLLIFFVI